MDTGEVRYAFRGWQLAVVAMGMLALGFAGALGGRMYTRHNEQHWHVEQKLQEQELINQNLVNAINQLAQRVGPPR